MRSQEDSASRGDSGHLGQSVSCSCDKSMIAQRFSCSCGKNLVCCPNRVRWKKPWPKTCSGFHFNLNVNVGSELVSKTIHLFYDVCKGRALYSKVF